MISADKRPVALRVLLWIGIVVLLAIGLALTGAGLLGLNSSLGRGLLCSGLVLLVCAVGGLAREVVERRLRQDPPRPRLEGLAGERTLHLPRATGPTLVSSWTLVGLALVAALGAVFTSLETRWGWTVALAVVAIVLAYSSAIHQGARAAGGLWLSPTGLVHDYRGFRVEVPWEDVTGVVPQQPMPILVRADRAPTTIRNGPRGRAWRPVGRDGTLTVDTIHLAGGADLASYVIAKAVTDPSSRRVLGSEESLPPRRESRGS